MLLKSLLSFSGFFSEWALQQDFPHVQIKHFAAQTALALEKQAPDTYDVETLDALSKVNRSHFSRVKEKIQYSRGRYSDDDESPFYFNHDLREGWFDSLSRVFSNTRSKDIVQQAKYWIKDNWNIHHSGAWSDDPRQHRWNRSRHDETSIRIYCYPDTDTYAFYLSIHAMFCVAGELLQNKAIRIGEWQEDLWREWLESHLLTRQDGLWLADLRDPKPRIYHTEQDENQRSEWCWSITSAHFDEILFPAGFKGDEITVKGNIYQSAAYEQTESISISSALVKPDHAFSLLCALQTCIDPFRFAIPDANSDMEINRAPYRMKGWLYQPEQETALDSLDRLSGNIPYPPIKIRPSIVRLMNLQKSTDDKCWYGANHSIVLNTEMWGTYLEDRYNDQADHGIRFVAKQSFILRMLKRLNYDLIIEVQIQRRDKTEHKEFDYVPGYSKLYLLKLDGTLQTLQRNYRIGKTAP